MSTSTRSNRRFVPLALASSAALLLAVTANTALADLTDLQLWGNSGDDTTGPLSGTTFDPATGTYTITTRGTDIWGRSDHGAGIFEPDGGAPVAGDFTAIVRSGQIGHVGEPLGSQWGRSGIMARGAPDVANSFLVMATRKSGGGNGMVLQWRNNDNDGTSRVDLSGNSPNAREPVAPTIVDGLITVAQANAQWMRLRRSGDFFLMDYADGSLPVPDATSGDWKDLRSRFFGGTSIAGTPLAIGLAHQAHSGGVPNGTVNTATFDNFSVTPGVDFGPDLPAFDVPDDLGFGGEGFMSVLEVVNNGDLGNITQTRASLNSGTGDRITYTTSSLNICDGCSAGRFGDDTNYGVKTLPEGAPLQGDGEINHIALAARGFIEVSAEQAGIYTFNVNSDDSVSLQFPGLNFEPVSAGHSGTIIERFENGYALTFPGGRGSSDSFGYINLPAGLHEFILMHHEGGGGAAVELSSAPGIHTSHGDPFGLVGGVARPDLVGKKLAPSIVGQWEVTRTARSGGNDVDDAEAQIRAIWADSNVADHSIGMFDQLNLTDPEGGGGGHGLPQDPFPGDTPEAENDFYIGARATMSVPEDGVYQFMTLGDDQSEFIIKGSSDWVVNGAGEVVSDNGDGMKHNACCGDRFGATFLEAGEYDVELFWQEGGGGAYIGLWAAASDGPFLAASGFNGDVYQVLSNNPQNDAAVTAVIRGGNDPLQLSVIPEPTSLVLAVLGLVGLLGFRRRRRQS